MDYQKACEYILDIPKFTKKNDPNNIRILLEALDNPQEKYKVIHIAGTNGKGSVCAFLSEILQNDTRKIARFTSPHLVNITERFVINGKEITKEQFLEGFRITKSAVEQLLKERTDFYHPTFFEWIFAMGCVIFAMEQVDIAIMETGLGGRLDATNVIERPLLTIITSISLDHTEILGDTIEQIAFEKAGIIKSQVPVVFDARDERAAKVIRETAKRHEAKEIPLQESMYEIFMNTDKSVAFSLDTGYYLYNDIRLCGPAQYQVINASLAVLAAEYLSQTMEISHQKIVESIGRTIWAGRMEEIYPDVYLDGGHNEAGMLAFTQTVEKFQKDREITLLFSAVKEKNYEQMIKTICDTIKFRAVIAAQVHGPRAVSARELADVFKTFTGKKVVCIPDIEEAFTYARKEKGEGVLFCAGSLYLVGAIKELIGAKEELQ